MQCPACSGVLRRVKAKNFVIAICPGCKGVWFESEDFAPFARQLSEREDLKPPPLIPFESRSVVHANKVYEEQRGCPKCTTEMRKFNYAYDSNIILDKCPNCGGIWTDYGEIQNVSAYLKHDPKADALGASIVKHQRDMEDRAAISEALSGRIPLWAGYFRIILPLGDENKTEKFPVITALVIGACTFIFALVLFSSELVEKEVFKEYGFVPARFFGIGLVTHMFLHAGVIHLLGNMYFLWIFGDNIEDRLGYIKYILFYLGAGIAAAALHGATHPGSIVPAVGASGAISGVMGAYLVFYPHAKIRLFFLYRVIRVPAVGYLGCWFIFQLLFGLFYKGIGILNVAWFAHIGGFVFGMAFAFAVRGFEGLKTGAPAADEI
jgi:membrane associated rhomboid family serine protease/Zn-finger nucleic acid-binding protein